MKKFVFKLLAAVIPFAVLFFVLLRVAYVTELRLLKNDLTFSSGVRAAIVGDSRVSMHFDDKEIPWLKNCGMSATPFEVTVQKARLIVELNPNLDFIVVDVWPRHLFRGKKPFGQICPLGVSLIEVMTREDMPSFGVDFPVRFSLGLFKPGLTHAFLRQTSAKSQIAGGFEENHRVLKLNSAKVAVDDFKAPPPHGELVLEHLLVWMQQHKKKVILTSTPLLQGSWPDPAVAYFEARIEAIAKKYGVRWYNWMHEYQDKFEYWADEQHLNYIGARQFSRDIKKILESDLECPPRHP